jgi:purine-binding chemotaxis protein CheW
MDESRTVVVFLVHGQRYALPLAAVERVVRAVEITPWPQAPGTILGAIDVQGDVLPVISLRRRFGLPEREVDLDDELLLARAGTRRVALLVDRVSDVVDYDPQMLVPAETVVARPDSTAAILKQQQGLVLVQRLERLLPPEVMPLEQCLPLEGAAP